MNEIAVVTAVTADYDHPRRREPFPRDVDHLFYADEASRHLVRGKWQFEPLVSLPGEHPRRTAKRPKLNPHGFPRLTEYRYVVWVDGGIEIRSATFAKEIVSYLDGAGIVLSPHHDGRTDAYGEATIRPPKYADEPLDAQVAAYRAAGYPGDTGLFECGVLAWDMRHDGAAQLARRWAREVEIWSYQDQVSLPFCLWELDLEPAVLPRSFRHMGWVSVNAHRREE